MGATTATLARSDDGLGFWRFASFLLRVRWWMFEGLIWHWDASEYVESKESKADGLYLWGNGLQGNTPISFYSAVHFSATGEIFEIGCICTKARAACMIRPSLWFNNSPPCTSWAAIVVVRCGNIRNLPSKRTRGDAQCFKEVVCAHEGLMLKMVLFILLLSLWRILEIKSKETLKFKYFSDQKLRRHTLWSRLWTLL